MPWIWTLYAMDLNLNIKFRQYYKAFPKKILAKKIYILKRWRHRLFWIDGDTVVLITFSKNN